MPIIHCSPDMNYRYSKPCKYGNSFSHSKLSCDDRFLPRRFGSNDRVDISYYCRDQHGCVQETTVQDIFSQSMIDYMKEKYRKQLQQMLCLPAPTDRILFHGKMKCSWSPEVEQHWPVKPRKQPFVIIPEIALDLPGFHSSYKFNVLDWGHSGYLSAALNTSLFLCQPTKGEVKRLKDFSELGGNKFATAVKWDSVGKLLAIGTNNSMIECWDVSTFKKLSETSCNCSLYEGCSIHCLAWHPNNIKFVSGCSLGDLTLMTLPNLEVGRKIISRAHEGYIISLQTSPDGHYLASAGNDKCIRIWLWPNLEPHFEIRELFHIKAVAWHPWQSSLLAVGGGQSLGTISLWNVNSQSLVTSYSPQGESIVLNLKWSSLSGELVVSFWMIGTNNSRGHSEVLVLSSLTKVVDKILSHYNFRVLYLLWSPDGKQLATASEDEILWVWNFMGPESKKKSRQWKNEKIQVPKSLTLTDDIHRANMLLLSKYVIR